MLLSHPRAGTSSPPGMPDLWGLAPVPALLSCVCHGSAGSVVVQCPAQGFCGSGEPTLLSSLLGWIEGLGVLLLPAGGQFGAACALSSTVYPESALLLDAPAQSPWLPRDPAGAWLLSSFSSRQFGISSVQGFLSQDSDYYPFPFPMMCSSSPQLSKCCRNETGVFTRRLQHHWCFLGYILDIKVSGLHPALVGWGTGWRGVLPSSAHLPPRSCGVFSGPRRLVIILMRDSSGPVL